ncbi:MAG: hypothetical protein AAGF23_18660, partial [Acidobacteriota bacterium]
HREILEVATDALGSVASELDAHVRPGRGDLIKIVPHVDRAEDLLQIWDDTAACGPVDELGVATDRGSSLQILDELMRSGTELEESDDALDPDNHTGVKKLVLELIESTQSAGISLALQFQKEVDSSCPTSGKWLSGDELTRIGNFMSHLSMAYPHVAGWFIDDFMGYLCDPWDAAGSTCLVSAETTQLQAASEPAAFWILATSTKAPYVVGGAHVLSAEGVRLRTSDSLDMAVTLHLPDELSEQDLLAAGEVEISFLTLDSDDTDYDPGSHCSRDGVLAVEVDGRLMIEDFLRDGHDTPGALGTAREESFELHRVTVPTRLLVQNADEPWTIEIGFSLRHPQGQPADYDTACGGSGWTTLSASMAKSVYVWNLEAQIGDLTLDEAGGHFEFDYSATAGVAGSSADLGLDHASSARGVMVNVARNAGSVTPAEAARFIRSMCGRDAVDECLVFKRGTRYKDKDPELDNVILTAAAAYGEGVIIESASNALANLPGEAGTFAEWPSAWGHDYMLLRHKLGQYGVLGWYQGYHFDLTAAVDGQGNACSPAGGWKVSTDDQGDALLNAEALIFEWDVDAGAPPSALLRTDRLSVDSDGDGDLDDLEVWVDTDSDELVVALHQIDELSGKRPRFAFSVEDEAGVCFAPAGRYVTGAHREALAFHRCVTDFFGTGDADCANYGDAAVDYWQLDLKKLF